MPRNHNQAKPTPEQLEIANSLGVQVSADDTFAVVAGHILGKVADSIGWPHRDVMEAQRVFANDLEMDIPPGDSFWSAYARIQEAAQHANMDALMRMELKPGDKVIHLRRRADSTPWSSNIDNRSSAEEVKKIMMDMRQQEVFEVSSISEDGRVYFKKPGAVASAEARHLAKHTATKD